MSVLPLPTPFLSTNGTRSVRKGGFFGNMEEGLQAIHITNKEEIVKGFP
jgi:hypothetical protein